MTLCEYANCREPLRPGQGVWVEYCHREVRFCSKMHAAIWLIQRCTFSVCMESDKATLNQFFATLKEYADRELKP